MNKKYLIIVLLLSLLGNVYFIFNGLNNNSTYEDEFNLRLSRAIDSSINRADFLEDTWNDNNDLMNVYYLGQLSHSLDRAIENSMFVNKYFMQLEKYHNAIQDIQLSSIDNISEYEKKEFMKWYKDFQVFEAFVSNQDIFKLTNEELESNWVKHKDGLGLEDFDY